MATSKVFKGVIWASIQRFGTMGILFATNIVLARILTPNDFGTIGMLLLFMILANTFVDSGFATALIQKKDADETDYSTVFHINLILSFIVYLILFCGAPLIADFYEIEKLCSLLRVEGLVLFLNALCTVQTCILTKKLDFKKLSICNLVGNTFGSIIAIFAAYYGFEVWSLIIKILITSAVSGILLWSLSNWRPKLVFSMKSFKELFEFGSFMLLSRIVYAISNNLQTIVIGKLFLPSSLGYYTQARQLRNVATDSVSSVINQVLYPEYANNQTDDNVLIHKLNLSVAVISFFSVGVMALCFVMAKPLIILLYGYKWINSIVFFQILCIAGCFIALQDTNINVVAAKGKSKVLFYCNIVKVIVFFLMLLLGAKLYGLLGLVIGNTLYSIFSYFAFSMLSSYYLKERATIQYGRLLRSIFCVILPSFIVLILNKFLLFGHNYVLILLFDTAIFIPLYWELSSLMKNEGCIYVKNILRSYLKDNNHD